MKYKVYPILLVIISLFYLGIFTGFAGFIGIQVEPQKCPPQAGEHDITIYAYGGYTVNGLSTILEKDFSSSCYTEVFEDRSCSESCAEKCVILSRNPEGIPGANYSGFLDASEFSHYKVNIEIYKGNTLVDQIQAARMASRRYYSSQPAALAVITQGHFIYMEVEADYTFPEEGEYRIEWTITESLRNNTKTDSETITVRDDGLEGDYEFTKFAFTCSETGKSYTTTSDDVVGGRVVFAGTNIFPSLTLAFNNLSETDYPCIEGSYNFNEPGTFTKTETTLTFTYQDEDDNTAKATFNYTLNGNDLQFTSSNSDGDNITIWLTKTGLIAGR